MIIIIIIIIIINDQYLYERYTIFDCHIIITAPYKLKRITVLSRPSPISFLSLSRDFILLVQKYYVLFYTKMV